MGVVISKPAINLREQLTELKAQQGYEEQQFHFDNLVTNGTFDTDTSGWTDATTGASTLVWNNGTAELFKASGEVAAFYQSLSLTAGAVYNLTWEDTGTGGNVRVGTSINGQNIVALTTDKSVTFTATAATNYLQFNCGTNNATAIIDNISVYTSDGTDVAFTMPKGWKPLHVYDDGVLQREGSAEDYEVTFDGFNYYVKPTVANPGARNTVIGVRA
jgi:hypothetical protein